MNTFGSTKNKPSPNSILGRMGFFDESDFEKETSLLSTITSTVVSVARDMAGGVYEAAADLGQTVIIAESKTESNGNGKFLGSIDFKNQAQQLEQSQKELEQFKKEQKETNQEKAFYQALKEDQERTRRAKDKLLFEEEINDIVTNLPTEQKNALLHYQASYRDRSIYQRAELRKKLIEERQKAEKQEKQVSIPSPARQPSALEGVFEGRSGSQGGGTANLSAQATG